MECKNCPFRITIVDDGHILYECSVRECPYEVELGGDKDVQGGENGHK